MTSGERLRDALRSAISRRSPAVAVATDRSGATIGTTVAGGVEGVLVRTETTAAAGAPALLAALSSGDLPTTAVDLTTPDASGHTITYAICGITRCGSGDQVP